MNQNQNTLVLMIHGGYSSGNRVDDGISNREIIENKYTTNKGNPIWTENLGNLLDQDKFEVFCPLFPNGQDMVYTERERFLNQVLSDEQFKEYQNLILISHSLGTVFLQKYLCENNVEEKFGKKLVQLHFVACSVDYGDFKLSKNWENILNQVEPSQIYLYYSEDDIQVELKETLLYKQNLGEANIQAFEDRGHFTSPDFPELVENIYKI